MNCRPKISRSFSDNLLLLGELNLEEPILESPEPSGEGLNGVIWETTSESGFVEAEPGSPRWVHQESLLFNLLQALIYYTLL